MSKKKTLFMVIGLSVLALVAIWVVSRVATQEGIIPLPINTSCIVGTVGEPASITFSGSSSNDDCNLLVSQYPQEYYRLSSIPSSYDVTECEGDIVGGKNYYSQTPSGYYRYDLPKGLTGRTHYLVQSASEYNPIGNAVCGALIGPG